MFLGYGPQCSDGGCGGGGISAAASSGVAGWQGGRTGVGGDPTTGMMLQHPLLMAATFGLGFHHFDFLSKGRELFWLYKTPTELVRLILSLKKT